MQTVRKRNSLTGFTFIELLVAVTVIAVGMVFVLGAFSQCVSALSTAEKLKTAVYLLNAKLWEADIKYRENEGSEEGQERAVFSEPYEVFDATRQVRRVCGDFGNATSAMEENLNEEITTISWSQGRTPKNLSVTRFVNRKKTE